MCCVALCFLHISVVFAIGLLHQSVIGHNRKIFTCLVWFCPSCPPSDLINMKDKTQPTLSQCTQNPSCHWEDHPAPSQIPNSSLLWVWEPVLGICRQFLLGSCHWCFRVRRREREQYLVLEWVCRLPELHTLFNLLQRCFLSTAGLSGPRTASCCALAEQRSWRVRWT